MKAKIEIGVLAVLVVIALAVWYAMFRNPVVASNGSAVAFQKYSPLPVENPALQLWKVEDARKTEYRSNGRNIFSATPPPPPPKPQRILKPGDKGYEPPPPPPPPAPPTLPVKYFGYGTVPNGTAMRAFLTDGESVYIVSEGETLLGRYRVLKIGTANLDFEEIGSGRRGTATIEPQGPSA
jgi:hypothetical protein